MGFTKAHAAGRNVYYFKYYTVYVSILWFVGHRDWAVCCYGCFCLVCEGTMMVAGCSS